MKENGIKLGGNWKGLKVMKKGGWEGEVGVGLESRKGYKEDCSVGEMWEEVVGEGGKEEGESGKKGENDWNCGGRGENEG